jgi:hypothetical protein
MIELNIGRYKKAQSRVNEADAQPSLMGALHDLQRAADGLGRLAEGEHGRTCYVPAETLIPACRQLFPPERMGVLGGRWIAGRFLLTAMFDVTGRADHVYVKADPAALGRALVAFDRAGVELAAWVHSHPGSGPAATTPSGIDRQQYANWTRDFGTRLVGFIAVRDGYVRAWGDAIDTGRVQLVILGDGVEGVEGHRHVYRVS